MVLNTLAVGFNVNCYIVGSEEENEAMVIDPGAEARRIFDVISESQLRVTKIVCTHGHYDHIGGVRELADLTGAEVIMHIKEIPFARDAVLNLSESFGEPYSISENITPVEDGDFLVVGEMRLKVLHTPGHTPGGMSIIAGEGVFCGDLVFSGSVGRTDLQGGSQDTLFRSIKEKILTLPDRLTLYPGHGPSTTIGEERKHNPYIISLGT